MHTTTLSASPGRLPTHRSRVMRLARVPRHANSRANPNARQYVGSRNASEVSCVLRLCTVMTASMNSKKKLAKQAKAVLSPSSAMLNTTKPEAAKGKAAW